MILLQRFNDTSILDIEITVYKTIIFTFTFANYLPFKSIVCSFDDFIDKLDDDIVVIDKLRINTDEDIGYVEYNGHKIMLDGFYLVDDIVSSMDWVENNMSPRQDSLT